MRFGFGFGFGSASPSTPSVPKVTGKDDYQFGDISKSLFRKLTGGGEEKKKPKDQAPGSGSE